MTPALVAASAVLLFAGSTWAAWPAERLASSLPWDLGLLAFALVGAFILDRRPGSVVAWLFCAIGCVGLLQSASWGYAWLMAGRGAVTPLARAAAWTAGWTFVPTAFLVLVVLPLRFPDGRLPARGWRWLEGAGAAVAGVTTLASWFHPGALAELPIANPLGVPAAAPVTGPFLRNSFALLGPVLLGVCWALVQRYRRADGVERAQLRWFVSAVVLLGSSALVGGVLLEAVLGRPVPMALNALAVVGVGAVPVSAAVAIQRYRLYAIDRIISRTVAYALLTGLLAFVYLSGTVLVSRLLAPVDARGDLAVAAATLAVAAAFRPARRRIQAAVDRRFDRARFDAEHTIAAFRGRVGGDVELEELHADLLRTARATLAPSAVSLWLRAPEGSR